MDTVFDGKVADLVLHLIEDDAISDAELAQLDRLMADDRPLRPRAVQHAALVLLMAATLVGVRFETLRAATVQAEIARPACDESEMSYAPSDADCAGGECVLQCGP